MLSAGHRAVLDAVARRVVPHAYAGERESDLVRQIEARLEAAPPERVRDLERGLTVLGSRVAALLVSGSPAPFTQRSAAHQDAMLARWTASPIPIARTIFQGVRRLVLAVYYSLPEAFPEIGYLGPLHLRAVVFPWEGPASGSPPADADEPVARTEVPSAAPPLAEHASDLSASVARPHVERAREVSRAAIVETRPTADVIVVGSGAGGAVVAARLAESGRDVLLIEEGEHVPDEELDEREGDMTARLYAEGGMRATDDLSFMLLQGSAVGGGTVVNWMITFRAPDHVLEEWTERLRLPGLSPDAMSSLFERVEREIHATVVPDDAHSPANRILLAGAQRLGWRAGAGRINARGCVRSGFCGQGCRYGAKQSTDRVYVPRALAAGARLVSNARVERVEVVERDTRHVTATRGLRRGPAPLKRVHATLLDPVTRRRIGGFVAEAPVVVLAAGAVGTPVILQRSGLGGGGVGRYLRLHPTTALFGEAETDVYAAAGIPQSAVCDEFSRRDEHGYGFWIECAPQHPGLAAVALPGFGAAHRDLMRRFRRTTNVIVLVRDGSDLDVSNGSVMLARSGRTRIAYRPGRRDRANLMAGVEAGARLLLAAGMRNVHTLHATGGALNDERDVAALRARRWGPLDLTMFSAHVNGTCRLGIDPRTSGANPDGERHGVRGLYIADGSLLPTGLGVNPQATIMALALRIAERMVEAEAV